MPYDPKPPCGWSHCGEPEDYHLHKPARECDPCHAPNDHHVYAPKGVVMPVVDPLPPEAPTGGLRIGEPVGEGLRSQWTVLDFYPIDSVGDEGVVLMARPHRFHPFVTERYGWRRDDRAFVMWGGTYHETLDEAVAEYRLRLRVRG